MNTIRVLTFCGGLLIAAGQSQAQTAPAPAPAAPAAAAAPAATSTPAARTAPAVPAAPGAAAPSADKTVEVNRAAKVSLVEGDVTVMAADKKRRKVTVGDYLVEGDSIITGKDSELHLDMEDGGYISVRPNTKMRIVKYQAKGEATDTGVFGLLEGGFRSLTGWIGKYSRANYTVRTPTATIGIRGTDHEPYVIPKGSSEGDPGTYDKVNEGGSYIQTAGGRAEVSPNQAGFVSNEKGARPRLLKEIPRHFRAGRHEALFNGRHALIQQRIEQRREERRNEIRQKLQSAKTDAATKREQRLQSAKEKREAAQKQREDARKAREEAKAGKASGKAARDASEEDVEKAEKAERAEHGKLQHKAHPLHKP
jgi:hypothetical protein